LGTGLVFRLRLAAKSAAVRVAGVFFTTKGTKGDTKLHEGKGLKYSGKKFESGCRGRESK